MLDFVAAEWARIEVNPIGQLASWIALLALFGVGIARPFIRLPIAFTGGAKILQFAVISVVCAVAVSIAQSNPAMHVALYLTVYLFLARVWIDNWYNDEGPAIGIAASMVAYNGVFLALGFATSPWLVAVALIATLIAFPVVGQSVMDKRSLNSNAPPAVS